MDPPRTQYQWLKPATLFCQEVPIIHFDEMANNISDVAMPDAKILIMDLKKEIFKRFINISKIFTL